MRCWSPPEIHSWREKELAQGQALSGASGNSAQSPVLQRPPVECWPGPEKIPFFLMGVQNEDFLSKNRNKN